MKKTIINMSLLAFIALLFACNQAATPKADQALQDDAKKYADMKCQMRLEIQKMQADTTIKVDQAKIDSIRKERTNELHLIRQAYESDKGKLREFDAAVSSELDKLEECKDLAGKKRMKKQATDN